MIRRVITWTSIILIFDALVAFGFYTWFITIYLTVDDCVVKNYNYDLYIDDTPLGRKYVCVPYVYVDYTFQNQRYSNVKSLTFERRNKETGIKYNHWGNVTEADCYNSIIDKYPRGTDIKFCYSTIKNPNPNCLCRRKDIGGSSSLYNDCCNDGSESIGFIISGVVIGLVVLTLNAFALTGSTGALDNRINFTPVIIDNTHVDEFSYVTNETREGTFPVITPVPVPMDTIID